MADLINYNLPVIIFDTGETPTYSVLQLIAKQDARLTIIEALPAGLDLTAGKNIQIVDNVINSGVPQEGQIKYNNNTGSYLITGLTFELDKRYEIIMSSYYKQGTNIGKQSKIVIFTSATLDNKFVISVVCYTASEIIKDYNLILANGSTGSLSISPAMEIVIYKIILLD